MATPDEVKSLWDLSDAIMNVDKDKLLRSSVGEVSLQSAFAPTLEEIQRKFEFAKKYAAALHNNQLAPIRDIFTYIAEQMREQVNRSNQDYVATREQFLTEIKNHLEELKHHWPPVVTVAVETRGFLEDEGVHRAYERTIESMKQAAANALNQVKEEAQKTIDEARVLAERIEKRARSTAAGISVEEVQKQFREAQEGLEKRVYLWAVLGFLSVVVFIGTAIYFARVGPSQEGWSILYHSAIRVSILMAIGTTAAFCLKILRAHLHISEKNRHRQRVANSMGAFVESASTPEQRDLILSQLVESVVQFGTSGLLQKEDDQLYRPKMTIDSITRTLSSHRQKIPE